jgi:hypothetical protein
VPRVSELADNVQVECGGPPLQLNATAPLKLSIDVSVTA